MKLKKSLKKEQVKELFDILQHRFKKNMNRHKNIEWDKVQTKLEANPYKLWTLSEMEIRVVNQMSSIMI